MQGLSSYSCAVDSQRKMEAVHSAIGNGDVDAAFLSRKFTEFLKVRAMQKRLRKVFYDRREKFKELGKIMNGQHVIVLKPNVKPVCEAMRRRSRRVEEVRKQAVEKFMNWGY